MTLELLPFSLEKDLPLINGWRLARKLEEVRADFLPPTGVMVTSDGVPLCVGFLYKTDARSAVVGNVVADPLSDKEVRVKALMLLYTTLFDFAKEDGFLVIVCTTNIPALMKKYEALGMIKTDENMSSFGRFI